METQTRGLRTKISDQTISQRKIRDQTPRSKLSELGDPAPKTGASTEPEALPRTGHSHQLPLSPHLTLVLS